MRMVVGFQMHEGYILSVVSALSDIFAVKLYSLECSKS